MNYQEMKDAFFAPNPAQEQTGWDTPARRLRDAVEPLATVSFWSEPAYDRYASLGLDFLTGYVWSRSSVLGEADAGVVAAAFGVFEPGAVAGLLGAAGEACSLADVRQAREQGAAQALRETVQLDDGAATALREASRCADVAGRPLYAGALGQPEPQDPYAALWHAATLVRECRGDSHLGACVAAGLTGLQANLLTELWVGYPAQAYAATRAWSPEAMAEATRQLQVRGLLDGETLTDAGREVRRAVEQATDVAMQPVVDALGDQLDDVVRYCRTGGDALVARGWFPPDAWKRAAG